MQLSLETLMQTYRELKAHQDKLGNSRPEGFPRAAWAMENPPPVASSFRVIKDGKQFSAELMHDTVPELWVFTRAQKPKLIERFDLRDDDAPDRVAAYSLPAPTDMTNFEFRAIRTRLGKTQPELAPLLGYEHFGNVSAIERETNPRKVPAHVALLMRAYERLHQAGLPLA